MCCSAADLGVSSWNIGRALKHQNGGAQGWSHCPAKRHLLFLGHSLWEKCPLAHSTDAFCPSADVMVVWRWRESVPLTYLREHSVGDFTVSVLQVPLRCDLIFSSFTKTKFADASIWQSYHAVTTNHGFSDCCVLWRSLFIQIAVSPGILSGSL